MILFTADIHLKLGQKNVPVSWAINRYREFFKQVHDIECDLHIIGGDLFDRVPSMAELDLYFEFVEGVNVKTLIYSGNHEATKKNSTFLTQLQRVSNRINPLVEIIDSSKHYDDYGILPYCNLHKKNSIEAFDKRKPLFTHVRGEIPPHVKPEVDLERFSKFPVVFAGDLHAHNNTQGNIVYPGSPLTTSFHRTEVKTGYLLIDEKTWDWEWKEFELPQLLRKTVTDPVDMVPTDYHHTIYEIEGDIQELAIIKNTDLLDKKVIKRSTEASLILGKDMTVIDELAEYLRYILEIPEEQINQILGTYHDLTKSSQLG